MQQPVIMAFRKRLRKRGYTGVRIYKSEEPGRYVVEAVEPLANVLVRCEYNFEGMNCSFRF